jgi:hypothetical protein
MTKTVKTLVQTRKKVKNITMANAFSSQNGHKRPLGKKKFPGNWKSAPRILSGKSSG